MTEAIELVGLASGVTAGFFVTPALGFAALSVGCLWTAWQRARKATK